MKSYLLSTLAQRYTGAPPEVFAAEFPHDWLLWEPGAWRAPRVAPSTLHVEAAPRSPAVRGEALALVLRPPAGREQLTLGRGGECDLVLNDAALSQCHLVFMRTAGGEWTVRDANSTNGSWVEGERLLPGRPLLLRPGTLLQAAEVLLTFHTGASLLARLAGEPVRRARG